MHIRYGYRIEVACDHPTPLITLLDVHPSRRGDITEPDGLRATRLSDGSLIEDIPFYLDDFGNICRRLIAPAGGLLIEDTGVIHDTGFPDECDTKAQAGAPEHLPAETLLFLLGSRYCETDKLSNHAWQMFGSIQGGWAKVQAVCDFVHHHIRFNYRDARPTRSASEAFEERVGVCRDYAHLAVTLCRCLNIPARYCTGYLGDIGVPVDPNPGDFSAWFEAYVGDQWWTFDARHNVPRIGRILVARGRDATDVPIINSFGAHTLRKFEVITDEITGDRYPATSMERRDHNLLKSTIRNDSETA